ncbi:FAD-binding oxidoreductase [Yoonia sp. 76]|nr:FAD-binding oxidoreductase [Yoonia sp. 76]
MPGDPDYERDRRLANPRFSHFPDVIVYCEVESDVAECLRVAALAEMSVVVRSGGHSTAGFSSQPGFLIDVSRMNDVFVEPAALRVWAGPGTTFRKLNAKIASFGLHTPGGACPDVCVGGYVQGGGYGFTARIFGMNCDQVEAVRVMLADGRIVTADVTQNCDLFWAVRGGTGSNFGVLIDVCYRLYQGNSFAGFSITWSIAGETGLQNTAAALEWLQANFMRTAPAGLGYQLIWVFEGPEGAPREPLLLMRGMYRGSKDDLSRLLSPVLARSGATLQALYDPMPYTDLNCVLLTQPYEVPQFPPNVSPMPPPEAKLSRYLDRPVSAREWLPLLRHFLASPSPYTIAAMEIYGGAIERPLVPNAFVHREVDCDLFFDVFWLTPAEKAPMLAYLDAWEKLVAPIWSGRVYQNYPSPEDPDFGQHYWGEVYPVLRSVKTKYDPTNRFKYPQSIPPLDPGAAGSDLPGLSEPIRADDWA